MQDFCVVSLSDCLTPWDKIEERLISAIRSDFVIALFNPKSRSRDWQFKYVIDLLLEHRRRSTPVALARQVGRPEQKISLCQLDSIPINQVDMVTVVLVGNSQSFLKDGWFVTPRGYSIS